MRDPTISVKENRSDLTDLYLGEGRDWGLSCSEPCCPMRPGTSFAAHQAVSQNHAQRFLISLSVLKPTVQIVLCPFWKVLLWVSESPSPCSSSLFQELGCAVLSLHVVVQESMCHVTLDHGEVQEGTSQESGFSIRPSEKHKSAFPGQSSTFNTSLTNLCFVWQVPAIPRSITLAGIFFRQVSQQASSFLLQLLPHYRLYGCISSWLPAQRSRYSSSLTTGSMAEY